MGKEHGLMDDLADLVAGRRPDSQVPFLKFGFGGGPPNQKLLTVVTWLLQGLAAKLEGAALARRVERTLQIFQAMESTGGHWQIGPACEVGTQSHRQLYYAGMAGALLGAVWAENEALVNKATNCWRVETAGFGPCHYVDPHPEPSSGTAFRLLTPGARNGTEAAPAIRNSLGDKLMEALLAGWKNPPRAGKGSYDVAIPLLDKAFDRGVNPASLLGGVGDAAQLDAYGFHRYHAPNGVDYFAWFENLPAVTDPLYGAGRVGGEIVLHWTLDGAREYGRALTGS